MMIDTGSFQEQMHTRFFRSLSFSISFSMSFSVSLSLSLFLSLGVSVSCTTIKCNYGQFDEIFSGGFDVQKADSTPQRVYNLGSPDLLDPMSCGRVAMAREE